MSRVAALGGCCPKSGPQASSRTDGPNSSARVMAHLLSKKKAGQASVSLSRFRDLLPSRHGRPARQRAPGFIASELSSNNAPGTAGRKTATTSQNLLAWVDHEQVCFGAIGANRKRAIRILRDAALRDVGRLAVAQRANPEIEREV